MLWQLCISIRFLNMLSKLRVLQPRHISLRSPMHPSLSAEVAAAWARMAREATTWVFKVAGFMAASADCVTSKVRATGAAPTGLTSQNWFSTLPCFYGVFSGHRPSHLHAAASDMDPRLKGRINHHHALGQQDEVHGLKHGPELARGVKKMLLSFCVLRSQFFWC